ncbi:zinc-binding alcohol dehydrogenase family protein [Caulobacter segnis]|uniref:Zinc-type alcohol dehydrogenase-like protein n=2 Tax=Caulobacter segnis TaxID=88688 RepID=D5VIN5_CAUST|nr:zinc-binding alcohol dehydrogenase family protein [Caulobacter segnis]ADG09851.1 zinc-binding alcohol dehydrogenase family protein [Caulobacter segnis ATCC 21756]AVQ01611.1 zinc-binding alcohol dehydrogenase family protein [Caulobacter segnis]
MKAIGYRVPSPIDAPEALIDLDLPKPAATGRDLLVAVKAVSVNPVDAKVRVSRKPAEGQAEILGYDAAGIVEAVGPEVTLFKVGDPVYYAGAIDRPGSNAEFQLVDERIVGRKPASLTFAEAAALPLTAITAWELLFDRLGATRDSVGGLLVTGAGGGVGSILVQIARKLTGLTVIGTASRPETIDWVKALGAHHVIDHGGDLVAQVKALDIPPVGLIASLTHTDVHFPALVEILEPQGRVGVIDDAPSLDVNPLKRKSASLHWEFMFARPLFKTPDMIAQHALLNAVADMIDAGDLRTTLSQTLSPINAANLKAAHAAIESKRTRGKIVLEGF